MRELLESLGLVGGEIELVVSGERGLTLIVAGNLASGTFDVTILGNLGWAIAFLLLGTLLGSFVDAVGGEQPLTRSERPMVAFMHQRPVALFARQLE